MAGSFSDYGENKALDHFLGTAVTAPTPWLGLFTADPGEAAGGTEATGGSYARVDVSAKFAAAASGSKASNAVITFPTATADWGSITHWAIFDAATVGNRIYHGSMTVTKSILNGDTATLASGAIVITLD